MKRLAITTVAAATVLVAAGAAGSMAAPTPIPVSHTSVATSRIATPVQVGHARAVLPGLRVAPDVLVGDGSGYDRRARFGTWRTAGRGCDERDTVLADELTAVDYRPGSSCDVAGGLLDGAPVTSGDVDIDHVVPLRLAWSSGAATWTDARRRDFANDRVNLRVERLQGNRGNGDEGPELSPPAPVGDLVDRCRYGVDFVTVAERYGLTVTAPRKSALAELVDECGS